MMRLKPSVSSRSSSAAPAGFSFTAASAMSLSLVSRHCRPRPGNPPSLRRSMDARFKPAHDDCLLVQIIRVFLHVLGEAERVVAYEILGALGVARFERLDDVDMIADRAVDAILLADGLAADHAHVGEQVCRQT